MNNEHDHVSQTVQPQVHRVLKALALAAVVVGGCSQGTRQTPAPRRSSEAAPAAAAYPVDAPAQRAADTVRPTDATAGNVDVDAVAPTDTATGPVEADTATSADVAASAEEAIASSAEVAERSVPVVVEPTPPVEATTGVPSDLGPRLYARHCASCHGVTGDGLGTAATFLYPRPRDLRAGRFRLASTDNRVPTRDDLHAVLLRGMPGSAMPPWGHLTQDERDALVDEVLRLRRAGARDFYIQTLKQDEELTDEEIAAEDVQLEIADYVERFTTPGESSVVPEIGPPTEESSVRGKEMYGKFGCVQCHGATGRGDGAAPMVDDEGYATRPRDFTLGIFKGSPDPASIYRRVAYGMPGTPMPASSGMTPEQMVDLSHYILAMSSDEQRQAAVLNRATIEAPAVAAIPDPQDAAAWSHVVAVPLKLMPLWWRNEPPREPSVQAVHDGTTLVLRISWNDPTHNDAATRPDQFEDMVAVELSAGDEPFLGMGTADLAAVDIWQWRAGTRDVGASDQQSDDYPFDSPIYRELAGSAGVPDFVSARALGNPLAVRAHDAAGLGAKGPSTLTFRPAASQLVSSQAGWNEGRWTVTLQRPMTVGADDGLSLTAGNRYSVAFAIWDGAAHDRGPQKLITVWNDLRIE